MVARPMAASNHTILRNATCGAVALLLMASCVAAISPADGCQPGQACWPSAAEVSALSQALDPDQARLLYWAGLGNPRVCGVGVGSPGQQPLYGAGETQMESVYVNPGNHTRSCFVKGFVSEFCFMATRNEPYNGWQPAFIVWPLNAKHVQVAVTFATKHQLPICVAGTGHDFLDRHSCGNNGLMIRTSLLNDLTYVGTHALRVGSGVTFAQMEAEASTHGQFVASGWAPTVGRCSCRAVSPTSHLTYGLSDAMRCVPRHCRVELRRRTRAVRKFCWTRR